MTTADSARIPQLGQEAQAHEAAGRLTQAQDCFAAIAALAPASAPARFQAGRIAYRRGRFAEAARWLAESAALKPDESSIWDLWAQSVRRDGSAKAAAAFRAQIASAPLSGAVRARLLKALPGGTEALLGGAPPRAVQAALGALQSGDAARAAALAAPLLRAHPSAALVANILGSAQAAMLQHDAAEASFRAAIATAPSYAEAHLNLGRLLLNRGRTGDAVAALDRAARLAPDLPAARLQLGIALARDGHDLPRAVALLEETRSARPDDARAHLELGRALLFSRDLPAAANVLHWALDLGADPVDARLCLARALGDQGRQDEARAELDRVLAAQPDCGPALASRAALHMTQGAFAAAEADFRAAIDAMPRDGETYRVFLLGHRIDANDPLIARMQALFHDDTLPPADRSSLGFALGKAMSDTGHHDQVFTYLRPANHLHRAAHPYDPAADRQRWQAIVAALDEVDLSPPTDPAVSAAPIFVTGLPRSGTTLVEQILASHSRVTGGGEHGIAFHTLLRTLDPPAPNPAEMHARLTAAGPAIAAALDARFPESDIVTDKNLLSHWLAGPIRLALPRARMLYVQRDARDVALSMFRNRFPDGNHPYSYSLTDLAAYVRLTEEILAYWQSKLPGWITVLRYEDLVSDPEPQTRALLAACGLDWEDACLSFHRSRRRVDTLSVHQVRQPINTAAVGGWRRYRAELAEFVEAWAPDGQKME